MKKPIPELKKITTSVFGRSLKLAKFTLSTGAKLTSYGAATLLSSKTVKDSKWQKFLMDRAGKLSSDLGELKGSLMKAGQMLSMYGEHFLPPEVNDILKSLQAHSPSVKWSVIEEIVKSQFSEAQLAELIISKVPLGSASLGQVHRAVIKATGREIVLKIQYPDLEKAIDSDLRALQSFLKLLKLLPRELNTDDLFSEVRETLIAEMDYLREAQETAKYRMRLAGDSRFIVPEVIPEFCSQKIIASSFESGVSPDDLSVVALSSERRNVLALNFLDLYFKEVFEWGSVQTDPHLGNYKIRINSNEVDQLVLLDFGALKNYSDIFLKKYRELLKASVLADKPRLSSALLDLNLIRPGDSEEMLEAFESFCQTTVEPFKGLYDWKNTDLPQRLTAQGMMLSRKFPLRTPPREFIFLNRKVAGVFIFCGVLKAKVDAGPLLRNYLKA